MQDVVVYLVLLAAVAYLVVRWARRRAAGNCCGEKECPAAKGMLRKFERGVGPKSAGLRRSEGSDPNPPG